MKVLVATDGSERAMKAVRKSLEMAEKEGADITLLSVGYYLRSDTEDVPISVQDALDSESRNALEKAKALFDEKAVKVNTILEKGLVPANVILEVAREGNFDHILLGRTGKTGIERYVIGSTATKVVAHAPCTVTVVR